MSRLIAVMDLGTNTFHLLIGFVEGGKIRKIIEEQRHVKLGEGGINKGTIALAAYTRGIAALRDFKGIIDLHPVVSVRANGTAALRVAKNGGDFIKEAKETTGIEIEIIAGDREAQLIYEGVRSAVDLGESSLCIDIGGGSVEFIFCNRNEVFWKKSYPVGAAKLMASYHHSDPISATDLEQIQKHLSSELKELKEKAQEFQPRKLVGSAGAFETFAALETNGFNKDQNLLQYDSYSFDSIKLKQILSNLIYSTHDQRAANSLIIPVRTDMIVVASVLTKFIMSELQISRVEMSRFSLKEGLLIDSYLNATA